MFIVLFALWIAFNGKITFEIIWIGLLICSALYWFMWKFLGYNVRNELKSVAKIPLFIAYFFLLIKEIFVANIAVLKIIHTKKEIKPVLYTFKSHLKSENSNVMLSHSITLTPGTITVELKGNEFVIHCLDESFSQGLEDSGFVKLLEKIEG